MAEASTDADVLVVGAGMAGLAAAHRLARDGHRAIVLERSDEPGGRVRSEVWEGCTIELGATFLTPGYRRVRRLISDCGLTGRLRPLANEFRIGVRRDGRWHDLDVSRPELALFRFGGIGGREKAAMLRLLGPQLRALPSLRFFDMASAASVDSRTLEDVIGPGANRYLASAVAEFFCGYPADEVSLAFGVLGARYPTRRMLTLDGGLGTLTAELADGLEVRCGVEVRRIAVGGGAVRVETGDGASLNAQAAIVATRAHEAARLWADAPPTTRRFLDSQRYTEGFALYLRTGAPVTRFDERGRELLADLLPRGEREAALLAVAYMNDAAPEGGLVGLAASPEAIAAESDDDALAERLEAELDHVLPELAPAVTARRILRWPIFVPSYPVGRARELAEFRSRLAPGPVQIAGDYLYGPMMEAAARAGEEAGARAAEHVRGQAS